MLKDLESFITKHQAKFSAIILVAVVFDVYLYSQIFLRVADVSSLKIYFLDVGQGDSEFAILPGGVKILIDGGVPNGRALRELDKILGNNKYIDMVLMSHPQLDHFGGLIDVLKRYEVGAFISNGRAGEIEAFQSLKEVIKDKNIKEITLLKGDKIINKENVINILSPDKTLLASKELNDTTLVAELLSKNSRSLFTGDIGFVAEEKIKKLISGKIDILKVPHHGSKYSSGSSFLAALRPQLAFIEVGKNSYGHPTEKTLERLKNIGAKIYRTDKDGTMAVIIDGKNMNLDRIR